MLLGGDAHGAWQPSAWALLLHSAQDGPSQTPTPTLALEAVRSRIAEAGNGSDPCPLAIREAAVCTTAADSCLLAGAGSKESGMTVWAGRCCFDADSASANAGAAEHLAPPRWRLEWRQVRHACAARARSQHTLVYDPARNVAVMFGGYSSGHGHLNDVVLVDLVSHEVWQPHVDGPTPPARRSHVAQVIGDEMWCVPARRARGGRFQPRRC